MTVTRLTGLTSGLDTDQLVKDLMKVEKMRYDKVEKERQLVEWKQETYRDSITKIKAFQDEYFDIVNSETGIRSASSFAEFTSSVQVNGEDKTYVSVTGVAGVTTLEHSISEIKQLAKVDEWYSASSNLSSISSKGIDADTLASIKASGIKFNLNLDGTTKEIEIAYTDLSSVNNVDDLVAKLNEAVQDQFGNDYSNIVKKTDVDGTDGIKFDSPGNEIKVFGVSDPTILKNLTTTDNSGVIDADAMEELRKQGMKFEINVDGKKRTIELTVEELKDMDHVNELAFLLNEEIKSELGDSYDDLVQVIDIEDGKGIEIKRTGNNITVDSSDAYGTLGSLGIDSGSSTTNYNNKTIGDLFNVTAEELDDFKINDVLIEGLTPTMKLEDFTKTINNSSAGVTLSYNSLDDRFTLKSTKTGELNNIDFSESEDAVAVFNRLGFDTSGTDGGDGAGGTAYRSQATNAILTLDNHEVIKANNEFTIDGAKYTLNSVFKDSADPIKISLKNDTDKVVEKIKKFVEDYNALIKDLNDKVEEKNNRDYEPLTAEEKKSLSEDEIKLWESKAKKGLMYRDPILTSMLDQLRSAFYDSVEGADVTLTEIGITTSKNYKDQGKLVIDEDKLKTALETQYTDVVSLFTDVSDKDYMDYDNIGERYRENGISNRLNDILSDVVRTTRNEFGKKGSLVEKAGLTNDASVVSNDLSKELLKYETRLEDMLKMLNTKEDSYYMEFAKMEAALSKLQQQTASLTQQLGG